MTTTASSPAAAPIQTSVVACRKSSSSAWVNSTVSAASRYTARKETRARVATFRRVSVCSSRFRRYAIQRRDSTLEIIQKLIENRTTAASSAIDRLHQLALARGDGEHPFRDPPGGDAGGQRGQPADVDVAAGVGAPELAEAGEQRAHQQRGLDALAQVDDERGHEGNAGAAAAAAGR